MQLTNTVTRYGFFARFFHWIMAPLVLFMLALGEYMSDLDYYDQWYHQAPWLHKSLGVITLTLLTLRLLVRLSNIHLNALPTHQGWERRLSKFSHFLFYILLFSLCISGYFVATAKGAGIEVFSWFEFPAIMAMTESQVDLCGSVHEFSTKAFLGLFLLHLAAVAKHHILDKDATLTRMMGKKDEHSKE